ALCPAKEKPGLFPQAWNGHRKGGFQQRQGSPDDFETGFTQRQTLLGQPHGF
ncbi:hypothetical protein P7K49_034020, partial [Saguinus oedipus]